MRILFLSDDFPPKSYGGAGVSTYELSQGFLKAGHDVRIFTAEESFKYHERWRAWRGLYNPPAIRELKKVLSEFKPDLVHINNIHFYISYHSVYLSKKYAKKVFITFRDTMSYSYGKVKNGKKFGWFAQLRQARKRWNPFRNFIIRRYLSYADQKLAVSDALRVALENNGIRGVRTIHTGIDPDLWSVTEPIGRMGVLFGGRISHAKGALLVNKISAEVPVVVVESLSREEMKQAYADSDVVLVPSIYLDPFPRMVLEAMASGRPVVATSFGGAKEAVIDGVTGFVVNPLDTGAVLSRLREFLDNPEKARQMGRAGRERIEKEFNLNDKIAELVSIYEKAH